MINRKPELEIILDTVGYVGNTPIIIILLLYFTTALLIDSLFILKIRLFFF